MVETIRYLIYFAPRYECHRERPWKFAGLDSVTN